MPAHVAAFTLAAAIVTISPGPGMALARRAITGGVLGALGLRLATVSR